MGDTPTRPAQKGSADEGKGTWDAEPVRLRGWEKARVPAGWL